MHFLQTALYTALIILLIKIICIILDNITNNLNKDILRNKLLHGHIISRRDIASLKPEVKIKNMFLHRLIIRNQYLMKVIPYKYVYDDNSSKGNDEFLNWCKKLLKDLDYENVDDACNDLNNCTNITCTQGNDKFYVQCNLLIQDSNIPAYAEDIWPKVGRPDVQKFVGAMLHDSVNNGIIITTGDFTDEASEYAKTLPQPCSLTLIDGCELTKTIRKLRGKPV